MARWQYLVLMVRRGNQAGHWHWTYGGLWGQCTQHSHRTLLGELFINYPSYCQNMIDSPPPSIIVMRALYRSPTTPRQLKYFREKYKHPSWGNKSNVIVQYFHKNNSALSGWWTYEDILSTNPSHLACLLRSYWVQNFLGWIPVSWILRT